MQINSNNYKYSPNFGLRVRLCDKSLMSLPHNKKLLQDKCPLDFFFSETRARTKIDVLLVEIKGFIRKYQNKEGNSEFKENLLRNCFAGVNKVKFFINKLALLKSVCALYDSIQLLKKINKNSPEYVDLWAKFGNSVKNKFVDLNIEDGNLEKIALGNKSTIFIMNHDNPNKDKFIYPILNSFLNYAYATLGKQENCPRSYMIVSKNVLKGAGNNTMRRIFDKMGLVPIDASLTERNLRENIIPMRELIHKFADNKANIFIFPEGNNSIYKDKTLSEKFQQGLSKMIKKILDKREDVDVVPVGISYTGDRNNLGRIFVGDTISLKRLDDLRLFAIDNDTQFLGSISEKSTLQNITRKLCSSLEFAVTESEHL